MSHALPCIIGIMYAMGRFSNGTEQSIKDNQSMNGVTDRESCEDIRSGAFAETHHFLHSEQAANTPPLITQRQRHNQAKLGLGQAQAPSPQTTLQPPQTGTGIDDIWLAGSQENYYKIVATRCPILRSKCT